MTMGERVKVTDEEKLTLLYERFRDVCLVEKEVWKEIFMPRDITLGGPVRTNIQDRYDVEIDDQELRDEETDAGGTLVLAIPEGIETGVRVKRRE